MTANAPQPGTIPPPVGLLAELTHRCPLGCSYCSNPLELERTAAELPTEIWLDVLDQAADLGVLQLHLSGGEPTARRDLEPIVAKAAQRGLYSNLITSGIGVTRDLSRNLPQPASITFSFRSRTQTRPTPTASPTTRGDMRASCSSPATSAPSVCR